MRSRRVVLLAVLLASAANRLVRGSASGYALTFDGHGTDIASTVVSADVFRGASGLTATAWIRSFGLIGTPYRQCVITFLTPEMLFWFLPFRLDSAGSRFISSIFDSSNPAGDSRLNMDAFRSWRHVAVSWSSMGNLQIYLDGDLIETQTGIVSGYNITDGAERGVYLGLGVHAAGHTTHNLADGFRGSIDQLQIWTRALTPQQVKADYSNLGSSAILPVPALRYTFDEGAGEVAANTGTAVGSDLLLGQSPDGGRFFAADGGLGHFQYSAPVWAPSDLPLNMSLGLAPIVVTFRPGIPANLSITMLTASVRIASLPGYGQLLAEGSVLFVGSEVASKAVVVFACSLNETCASTSFHFTTVDAVASGECVIRAHALVYCTEPPQQ